MYDAARPPAAWSWRATTCASSGLSIEKRSPSAISAAERDHSGTLCTNRDSCSRQRASQPSNAVAHPRQRASTRRTRADSEHDPRVVGPTALETRRERCGRVPVERYDADADVDAFRAGQRGVEESSRIRIGGDAIEPEALVTRLLGQRGESADGFGPERARHSDAPFR